MLNYANFSRALKLIVCFLWSNSLIIVIDIIIFFNIIFIFEKFSGSVVNESAKESSIIYISLAARKFSGYFECYGMKILR